MTLALHLIRGEFAVCRLPPNESVPAWASSAVFSSVTRTPEELSVCCPAAQVPPGTKHESNWRLLKIEGPFDFGAIGILAAVLAPFATAGVSSLAIATFDTDYVLVQAGRLEDAIRALEAGGHTIKRQA